MDIARFFRIRSSKQKEGPSSAPLVFFNTLSKKKEEFTPLNSKLVKMYNCGPTVYDDQHIGNLRPYVMADIVKRTLVYNGYPVRQVVNITDVGHLTSDGDEGEDKMEEGAARAGVSARTLATKVTRHFKTDLNHLNINTQVITFTRATDYIDEQIALIKTLEERGYTYQTHDGIYYDISRFPDYGKLGNIKLNASQEGARVEANPEKRHPADFALWKFSPKSEESDAKRQQEWDSPWGVGFPGWHLECTAMIFAELGRHIDIHTGGIDHIPVHHNNEIAQAEAVSKKQYVNYWLHNAFITIEGQKISKSIGNTILLRQLEDRKFSSLAYRYWLLTGHYRSPMNFTWEALSGAQKAFSRLLRIFVDDLGTENGTVDITYQERFHERINDDLDTPGALAILWELARDETVSDKDKRMTFLNFDKVLGLGLIEGHRKLKIMLDGMERKLLVDKIPDDVRELIAAREKARKEKAWEEADTIRKTLESRGYTLEDTPEGPEIKEH